MILRRRAASETRVDGRLGKPESMKVFKFGGASVKSSEGVENLCTIVRGESAPLFVVVSAMGKTTNAMEEVLAFVMERKPQEALQRFGEVEAYHNRIMRELFPGSGQPLPTVSALYDEVRGLIAQGVFPEANPSPENPSSAALSSGDTRKHALTEEYDRWYDSIVGYGELISTMIVSEYLNYKGVANRWIDMRRCFVTDDRFREANIDTGLSAARLREAVAGSDSNAVCENSAPQGGMGRDNCPQGASSGRNAPGNEGLTPVRVFVGQGFIGATADGIPTTLGREGSDYSAAMAGNLLDAESVSIWKDVEGILNADPRIFKETIHIPRLTYLDAIELAYSGAQVIHPKTIKPLQNKMIPLYVRPFADPSKPGSVILGEMEGTIGVPVFILKRAQVLVSIRPKDFSFVLEERLPDIFTVFGQYRQKINLIQSSAVNLSVCVDESRHLERVVEDLQADFRVVYNRGMELLTIRGYTPAIYESYTAENGVYLVQKTRRIARIVRHGAI